MHFTIGLNKVFELDLIAPLNQTTDFGDVWLGAPHAFKNGLENSCISKRLDCPHVFLFKRQLYTTSQEEPTVSYKVTN